MEYNQLNDLLQGRNKNSRKLANNTYALRYEDRLAIRLHDTDIITFTPRAITVNTGGWKTVTTKQRLNEYLPSGHGIHQERGIWYWYDGSFDREDRTVFSDGDRLIREGKGWALRPVVISSKQRKEEKRIKGLMKDINGYAKLCADAVPMPIPGAGDCMFCHSVVAEGENKGKPLGEVSTGKDHLLSHMSEGYVVPSLVYTAMKYRGCTDMVTGGAFAHGQEVGFIKDVAKDGVKRGVKKYLCWQLGLVS